MAFWMFSLTEGIDGEFSNIKMSFGFNYPISFVYKLELKKITNLM